MTWVILLAIAALILYIAFGLRQRAGEQGRPPEGRFETAKELVPALEDLQEPRTGAEDRIVALVKAPQWIYVYWDFSRPVDRAALRVVDLTAGTARLIEVGSADNWFIETGEPGHRYVVELGHLTPQGFERLASSAAVETPAMRAQPEPDAASSPQR